MEMPRKEHRANLDAGRLASGRPEHLEREQ